MEDLNGNEVEKTVACNCVVTVTDTPVKLLDVKTNRHGLILQNNSAVVIWIRFCDTNADANIKSFCLAANSAPFLMYDNKIFLGEISAVCESGESGDLHISEY